MLWVGDPHSDNSPGLLLRALGSHSPQGLVAPCVQAGKGRQRATLDSAAISPVDCTETMSFLADKCPQAYTRGDPPASASPRKHPVSGGGTNGSVNLINTESGLPGGKLS